MPSTSRNIFNESLLQDGIPFSGMRIPYALRNCKILLLGFDVARMKGHSLRLYRNPSVLRCVKPICRDSRQRLQAREHRRLSRQRQLHSTAITASFNCDHSFIQLRSQLQLHSTAITV